MGTQVLWIVGHRSDCVQYNSLSLGTRVYICFEKQNVLEINCQIDKVAPQHQGRNTAKIVLQITVSKDVCRQFLCFKNTLCVTGHSGLFLSIDMKINNRCQDASKYEQLCVTELSEKSKYQLTIVIK